MMFSPPFLISPPGVMLPSPGQSHEMMQHVEREQGISPSGQLCGDPAGTLSFDSETDYDREAGTDDGAVDDVPNRTLNMQRVVVTQADSLKKALFSGLLQEEFGHSKFRDGQLPALLAIDKGCDCVVTLPTGGGKSLLYQLFSISREKGVCLTICPTIAIMEQQSSHRVAKGVYVSGEWKKHTDDILAGKYRVLYLAPEWLSTNKVGEKPAFDEYKLGFLEEVAKKCGINLITIDGSHLTLNWSKCSLFLPRWLTYSPCSTTTMTDNFRPAFDLLPQLRARLGIHSPLLLLSGSPEPQAALADHFRLETPCSVEHVCTRPNLNLEVRNQKGSFAGTLGPLLHNLRKETTVVYCNSAAKAKKLAAYLSENGTSNSSNNALVFNQQCACL